MADNTDTCADRWHRDDSAPHREYMIEHPNMTVTGYQCLTCGFRTVSVADEDGSDVTDRYISAVRLAAGRAPDDLPFRDGPCRGCGRTDVPWGLSGEDLSSHEPYWRCDDCAVELIAEIARDAR